MDDLDPVPHTRARRDPPLAAAARAHRQARRVGGARAPGRGRRAHRRRRERPCRSPFPVGVAGARPYLRSGRTSVARYVGEPLAVVVARDRYVAEDALELIEVELRAARPRARSSSAGEVVSDRRFVYGDPDAAFAGADLVVESAFTLPALELHARRVLRRRRRLGRRRPARSPPGRTSRARSRSIRSPPPRSGCPVRSCA